MRWQTQEQYLRMMLARQLDIPMLGKIFYAVPQGSSTSLYEDWARNELDIPAELLFTGARAPSLAYEACSGYRNDVVCVFPGAYDIDTELAWAKYNTHLVGMGGPNVGGDWSEPNVVIYSDNIATASIITATGPNCQFHNFAVSNYGNNAACLTAFTLNNYGCLFKNVGFQGNMTTNQNTTVAAASLYIGGSAHYPLFDHCTIGQDVWGERSGANSGQLRFSGSTQPNGGWLRDCKILSRSITATCAAVSLAANGALGRDWIFDNCVFSNEYGTPFTNLTHVFYDNDTAGQSFLLKRCTAKGYTEWQSADRRIFADMPVVGTGGGLCAEPTAATGS